MPASDALHMKAVLTEELREHSLFPRYLDRLVESMVSASQKQQTPMPFRTGEMVRQGLLDWLKAAENYYVSTDMIRLAVAAAETLPNDAVVEAHHVPSPRGFLWLPEPVRVYDIRGQILSLSACAWAVYGGHVHLWWLTDKYDKVDSTNLQLLALGDDPKYQPRLSPMHYALIGFGKPLPTTVQLAGQKIIPPGVNVSVFRKDGNVAIHIDDEGMNQEGLELVESPARDLRFLTVIWRLMRQTLVDIREEDKFPKATKRLVQRQNMPDSKVSVITLRHKTKETSENREVQWTHRWLVRGYWRRQWYGPMDGERWCEDIWVHPHVKGPEGAPLLIREHVNALVR